MTAREKGECFKDALSAVIQDVPVGSRRMPLSSFENLAIVHGTARVTSARTGRPIRGEHAWVEFSGGPFWFVYDPSIGQSMDREEYYEAVEAKPERRYERPLELVGRAYREGHYGPYASNPEAGVETFGYIYPGMKGVLLQNGEFLAWTVDDQFAPHHHDMRSEKDALADLIIPKDGSILGVTIWYYALGSLRGLMRVILPRVALRKDAHIFIDIIPGSTEIRAALLATARVPEPRHLTYTLPEAAAEFGVHIETLEPADREVQYNPVRRDDPARLSTCASDRCGAAMLFWCEDDDTGLLLRRSPKTEFGGLWDLPGGGVKTCETPWGAALRETHEEIHWFPLHWRRGGDFLSTLGDFVTFKILVSAYEKHKGDRGEITLNWEHDAHAWFSQAGIHDLLNEMRLHPSFSLDAVSIKAGMP